MNNSKSFEVSIALQTDKPISEYGRVGKLVEILGFDAISVYNDMLFQPAWLPLMQIAQQTQKNQIGTSGSESIYKSSHKYRWEYCIIR